MGQILAFPPIASDELVVNVMKRKYGTVPFLFSLAAYPNLLNITRPMWLIVIGELKMSTP